MGHVARVTRNRIFIIDNAHRYTSPAEATGYAKTLVVPAKHDSTDSLSGQRGPRGFCLRRTDQADSVCVSHWRLRFFWSALVQRRTCPRQNAARARNSTRLALRGNVGPELRTPSLA